MTSLVLAALGFHGFSKLGLVNKAASSGGSPPAGTTGQPMGLLLALTYAS